MVGLDEKKARCIICGGNDYDTLYTSLPDYLMSDFSIQASYVRCKTCGLIFQITDESIDLSEFYPHDYDPYITEEYINGLSIFQRFLFYYGIQKRRRIVERFKDSGNILDIGCSTGIFLTEMQKTGKWNCFGVEPNPYAASTGQKLGLRIHIGKFEETFFPEAYFDVITMWDVLEHVTNPKNTISEIYRILSNDGVLVVRLPNYDSLDAKMFGQYWAGFDPPRHLFVFNRSTLSNLFRQCGFEIIYKTTNVGAFPTFLLSFRFLITSNPQKFHLLGYLYNYLSNPIFRILLSPLFFMIGFLSLGPSLVVVAKKVYDRNSEN
jgi:2-polyprenyl-3-methyl-5-hydroxy-6-metoxy-1,4-benzoquinol methylase